MFRLLRTYTAAALLVASCTLSAQTAPATGTGDFYTAMLRRGIASLDAGKNEEAARLLRIAAFGFVDALELYQVAGTYLTVAHDRAGEPDRAREAARKVVAAQRRSGRFAALDLPAEVRQAFDSVAARVLTPAEIAALRAPAEAAPATQPQPRTLISAAQGSPTLATPPRVSEPGPSIATSGANGGASQPTTTAAAASAAITPPEKPAAPATRDTSSGAAAGLPATPPAESSVTGEPAPSQQPTVITTEIAFPPAQPEKQQPSETAAPTVSEPASREPARAETPQMAPPAAKAPAMPAKVVTERLAAADRALNTSRLPEARAIYRELLSRGTLDRAALLRVAEGLYRSRDFAFALEAFRRLGTLGRGEEPYRYYIAVALYETGAYAAAKDALREALPYIEVTPDVARYQAKIEGAIR